MHNGDTHKSAIQAVRDLMKMIHGRSWVLHQSGRVQGSPGIPDMYCIAPAASGKRWWAFWVEVKVARDKLSADQVAFLEENKRLGIPVIVGTAGDVADFLGYSDARGRT
jgi:hypothetical protein